MCERALGALLVSSMMLSATGCSSAQQPQAYNPLLLGETEVECPDRLCEVSIVRLISRPEIYQGKDVSVVGFARLRFEGTGFYLSREDGERGFAKNGLWLAIHPSKLDEMTPKFDGKLVRVNGVFDGTKLGHMAAWSGTIRDIWLFELIRTDPPQ